jgi:hypothetical protein
MMASRVSNLGVHPRICRAFAALAPAGGHVDGAQGVQIETLGAAAAVGNEMQDLDRLL